MAKGFVNRMSNFMNKGKGLTPDQKEVVQESLRQHKSRQAWQQTTDFLDKNSNGKYASKSTMSGNFNNFNDFQNMKYNTLKNKYMNNMGAKRW